MTNHSQKQKPTILQYQTLPDHVGHLPLKRLTRRRLESYQHIVADKLGCHDYLQFFKP